MTPILKSVRNAEQSAHKKKYRVVVIPDITWCAENEGENICRRRPSGAARRIEELKKEEGEYYAGGD